MPTNPFPPRQTPNPFRPQPTYEPDTFTYTDSSGNKQSRRPENIPTGTKVINRSGGRSSYNPDTKTLTSSTGLKSSVPPENVPIGTNIETTSQSQIMKVLDNVRNQPIINPALAQRTTTQNYNVKSIGTATFYNQPYLTENEAGKIILIDPTVVGKQYEREATPEEKAQYYVYKIQSSAENTKPEEIKYGKVGKAFYEAKNYLHDLDSGGRDFFNKIGLNEQRVDKAIEFMVRTNPISLIPSVRENLEEFYKVPAHTFLQNPNTIGLNVLIGSAFALGTGGLGLVAEGIGFAGASTIGRIASYGALGYFGVQAGKDLITSPDVKTLSGRTGDLIFTNILPFYAGTKIVQPFFEPIYYKSVKEREINKGLDIVQPIITSEGEFGLGKYKLYIKPEVIDIYADKPIKAILRDLGVSNRFTGMRRIELKQLPNVKAEGTTITQRGEMIGQQVSGVPSRTLRFVTSNKGIQEEFNIKNFDTELSKIEQYNLKEISKGFLLTKEGIQYYKGELETTKAFRVSGVDYSSGQPKGTNINIQSKLSNPMNLNLLREYVNKLAFDLPNSEINIKLEKSTGKNINRYSTITAIQELGEFEGSTYYKTKMGLKDTNKPNTRATGRITEIKGFTKVLEPIYEKTNIDDFKIERPIKSEGKQIQKISQDFIKKTIANIQVSKGQAVEEILTRSSKTINAKVTEVINKDLIRELEMQRINQLPKYVGGGGQSSTTTQKSFELELFKSNSFERELSKIIDLNIEKSNVSQINKSASKTIQKESLQVMQKEAQKVIEKLNQKAIEKFLNKNLTPSSFYVPKRPPRPPIEEIFDFGLQPKFKTNIRKENRKGKGGLTYIPDYTSIELDFRKQIKQKDLDKLFKEKSSLGIREKIEVIK